MWLNYPEDPEAVTKHQQFMVGPDILVVPVLSPGEARVSVYLPAGRWTYLWNSSSISSAASARTVELPVSPAAGSSSPFSHNRSSRNNHPDAAQAPVGRPAVLCRQGSDISTALTAALGQVTAWECSHKGLTAPGVVDAQ